jgi:hypothetical protein
MKPIPSFSKSIHVSASELIDLTTESQSNMDTGNSKVNVQVNPITGKAIISKADGSTTLNIDQLKRKRARNQSRQDPVLFRDLHVTSDYDQLLKPLMDPMLHLNVKGPLANLWFGFKADTYTNSDGHV